MATERLESSESRLDKIIELISVCSTSVHDLSRCRAEEAGEFSRMNMPFELGLDMGFRCFSGCSVDEKKFLIFEKEQYDLKQSLSDLAGADVEYHKNDIQLVIKKLRNFLKVEVGCELPGATKLLGEYATFLGWMTENKIHEGHTEEEALELPTQERLDEMLNWVAQGRPSALF